MDVVLALGHFCDLEGPTILFYTEPYVNGRSLFERTVTPAGKTVIRSSLSSDTTSLRNTNTTTSSTSPSLNRLTLKTTLRDSRLQDVPVGASQTPSQMTSLSGSPMHLSAVTDPGRQHVQSAHTQLPDHNSAENAAHPSLQHPLPHRSQQRTELPESFPNELYSTQDPSDPRITYISARYPKLVALFGNIKQACHNMISSETGPLNHRLMCMGDEDHGYAVSVTFIVKDRQSRNQDRTHVLLLFSMDPHRLMSVFPVAQSEMMQLAEKISAMSNVIFHEEELSVRGVQAGYGQFHPWSRWQEARSLSTLLRNENFFEELHNNFCHILHSCLSTEASMASRLSALPSVGHMQRQRDQQRQQDSLVTLYRGLGSHEFRRLVFNCLALNQVVVRGETAQVESVLSLLQALVPDAKCRKELATSYLPVWTCQLLGLPTGAEIPDMADRSSLILLDIDVETAVEPGGTPVRRNGITQPERERQAVAHKSVHHRLQYGLCEYVYPEDVAQSPVALTSPLSYTSGFIRSLSSNDLNDRPLVTQLEDACRAGHPHEIINLKVDLLRKTFVRKCEMFTAISPSTARLRLASQQGPLSTRGDPPSVDSKTVQLLRSLRVHRSDWNLLVYWSDTMRKHRRSTQTIH